MKLDLPGRVSNIKLPKDQHLMPLFEAISNSLHAIEEYVGNGNNDGVISISLLRDTSRPVAEIAKDKEKELTNVIGFKIVDNGIGFTDDNFQSFERSDSTYKIKKGGKGLGRLSWLKAFDVVNIDSVFQGNNCFANRKFKFSLSSDGISDHIVSTVDKCKNSTSIVLSGYKSPYRESCPKKAEVICSKIIEHFLLYFLSEKCPAIYLDDHCDVYQLNEIFKIEVAPKFEKNEFKINNFLFNLFHFKNNTNLTDGNRVLLCAHNRVVTSRLLSKIDKHFTDLEYKVREPTGVEFYYSAYITGDRLDNSVNAERTNFNLPKETSIEIDGLVSFNDVIVHSIPFIRDYLEAYIIPMQKEKINTVRQYIETKGHQYRPVLKHKSESISSIPLHANEEQIEIELHKIYYDFVREVKAKGSELLKTDISSLSDYKKYMREHLDFVEKENDIGKSRLAEYVIHRKIIINILENSLTLQEDGRFSLEEGIHSIIYPMRCTSEDIIYDQQNLWLLDERLSFHTYLASDRPIKTLEPIETSSTLRTDLVIFDSPFIFGDTEPHQSIVVIEFKRPQREDYTELDNPISQIYKYARTLRAGTMKSSKGRYIGAERCQLYGYIVCDIVPSIKELLRYYEFTISPDALGYFKYHKDYNMYIELVSYNKMIADAKKRNDILFKSLNLPQ